MHGTAVFFDADVGNATNPTRAESIVGRSGWFQEGATVAATTELQLKFQDSLGQYEASELDPPSTWEDVESMNDTVSREEICVDRFAVRIHAHAPTQLGVDAGSVHSLGMKVRVAV